MTVMLSAVAARKAALGVQQEHPRSVEAPKDPNPSLSSSSVEIPPHSTKRKSSGQIPRKTKKKVKVKHAVEQKPRYFAEDAAVEQEDVVITDSDKDDEDLHLSPTPITSPPDSSDDSEGSDDEPNIPDTRAVVQQSQTAAQEQPVLSTFHPLLDQNTFRLTSDEIGDLHLSNRYGEFATVLFLSPMESLALLGTYTITVLQGSMSLLGVTITSSKVSHRVFAPRSAAIPVLRCISPVQEQSSMVSCLPSRIRNSSNPDNIIVVLQDLRTGIEGLGRICQTFDGVFAPSRWQKQETDQQLGIPGVYVLTRQGRDIQPFLIPSTWEKSFTTMDSTMQDDTMNVDPIICLIKGPKKSGKSTFARTLLNILSTRYQKVAFLECDLGQSEFTPGGMVSLNISEQPVFGPPFTHPTLPHLAHYIGAASPRSSPSHYLAAIQSLLEVYRLDIQSAGIDSVTTDDDRISSVVPLVVNTMGWSKGLGADLTCKIEEMVEATDVFETEAFAADPSWSTLTPPAPQNPVPMSTHAKRLHLLEPIPASVLSKNYSPADHRTLSILSYFHAVFPHTPPGHLEPVSATSWNTTLPLCAQAPYEVDWTIALDKVILTGSGSEDVVSSEIERVLNGAVVGLLSYEPNTLEMDSDISTLEKSSMAPYTQGFSVPSPSTSACHGLALIRGVSSTSSHMQILTPVSPYLFSKCRIIVKGELELPIWGMLDFRTDNDSIAGVEKNDVPYLQWGKGEGLGGERRRVRRNLMRKGQM